MEQQNRILKLQVEAYKAALEFKYAELAARDAKDPKERASAEKRGSDAQAALQSWNRRISEEADKIRVEDHCPKCVANADFTWASEKPR